MKSWIPIVAIVAVALMLCAIGYNQSTIISDLADTQSCLQETQEALADTTRTAETAAGAAAEERVLKLPEGVDYYTTLAVHKDWQTRPNEREFVSWFSVQPELASLKAQTTFALAEEGNAYYKNHVQAMGDFPGVMIQTDAGRVVYKVAGNSLPASSGEMAAELVTLFEKRPWLRLRPWLRPRPCPCPKPGPAPGPEPKPSPDVDVKVNIPVLRPPAPIVAKEVGDDFWVILSISLIVAAAVTIVAQFRARM
ncbi:MAG TPA: hypothetical protein VM389_13100 [Phycisphaerae bacterium]|nr:hypothetical protein [Phycisphaerae bacterium]